MKASWSGYLSLGKLAIPVRLYSAVRSVSPHFIQVHAKDYSPITRIAKCKKENREIESSDIIRAVEHNGKLVEVNERDMKYLPNNEKSITVSQFSDPQAINPVYYDKPYYIVPTKGGEAAYTLIREAFAKVKKIAIVRFVYYEKERIGIVMPYDGMLMLHQLRFAEEMIPRLEIKTPSLPQPTPGQVSIAAQLMERYSAPFYIEDYRNEQFDYLQEIIERKSKGLPPKRPERIAPHATPEDEIMAVLTSILHAESSQPMLQA